MTILPPGRADTLSFFEAHIAMWLADPGSLGLSELQIEGLADELAAARKAFAAAGQARLAALAATQASNDAIERLRRTGSGLIGMVKSFARVTDDPSVLVRSGLPAPSTSRAELPAPSAPTTLRAAVDALGVLTLRWDAETSGPSTGVLFEVLRKLPGVPGAPGLPRGFTFVGAPTVTMYRDDLRELPAPRATYCIRAVRGTRASAYSATVEVDIAPRVMTVSAMSVDPARSFEGKGKTKAIFG